MTMEADKWRDRYNRLRALVRECSSTVTVSNDAVDRARGSHNLMTSQMRLSRDLATRGIGKSDAMYTTDNAWGEVHVITSSVCVLNPVLLAELDREVREGSN